MRKEYREPVIDVITFETDEAIAAREDMDIISGFENGIPIDGDTMG